MRKYAKVFALFAALTLPAMLSWLGADVFLTTGNMRTETRMVTRFLENQHILRKPLEDLDPRALIETFLSDLDAARLFLTRQQVGELSAQYEPQMIPFVERGNLQPAFELFEVFRTNALRRLDWVDARIQQPFDFSTDEFYVSDRTDAEWPSSTEEADDLWERRLKYQMLNELLAKKDDPEASSSTSLEESSSQPNDDPALDSAAAETSETTVEDPESVARETLSDRYDYLRETIETMSPVEVQEVFLSSLAHRYDPHSTFMSVDTLEEFEIAMKNSLVGIGAVLSQVDAYCEIRELIHGGPASKSGELGSGDRIVGVGQGRNGEMEDVVGMRLNKIVQLIRGEKGTVVRLLIQPSGMDPSARKVVSLVRDMIKLTSKLATAEIFEVPVDDEIRLIGVIELPAFYGSDEGEQARTTEDVRELLRKLKTRNVEAVVLDLRNNGGGLLSEAVDLTGLFIPSGPVVQVRDFAGNVQTFSDEDIGVEWEGPLAVLVSRFSASASEITAGALQVYKRAIVIGDAETHGKGTVQAVYPLSTSSFLAQFAQRGAAKITVQKFYLPDGSSTQIRGVASDIPLPSVNQFLPIGERDLDNALPWDSINATWIPQLATKLTVSSELEEFLIENSLQRQQSLPEFDHLNEGISRFEQRFNQKTISLNLDQRKAERIEEDRLDERFEERAEKLAADAFPSTELLLDIAAAQATEKEAEAETAASEPKLDVHLREALRIMGDWIHFDQAARVASSPLTSENLPKLHDRGL